MQQCCFGAFQCRRPPPSPLLVYHHRHRPNSSSPIKPGLPLPWLFDGKSRREREKERGGRSVGGRSSATVAITAATGVGWGRGRGGFASVRPSVGWSSLPVMAMRCRLYCAWLGHGDVQHFGSAVGLGHLVRLGIWAEGMAGT